MKKILFIFLISLNTIWANSNYWDVLPYPIDNSLDLDERVELKYQDKNGTRYIREVRVFGLTKYLVNISNEEAVTIQARSIKVWIKESEFNLEKEIDKFEPRVIKKAYKRLLKTLKKKKIELESHEFYTLVYEVGIHDKTVRQINDLAYYYTKEHPASKLLVKVYEDILSLYPNRTVTYYNLADAYWALGRKKEAKKMYEVYAKQMKARGKEKRVPKVVKERIK